MWCYGSIGCVSFIFQFSKNTKMKVKVLPRGFTHAHSLGSSSSVVSLVMPMRWCRCLRVSVVQALYCAYGKMYCASGYMYGQNAPGWSRHTARLTQRVTEVRFLKENYLIKHESSFSWVGNTKNLGLVDYTQGRDR